MTHDTDEITACLLVLELLRDEVDAPGNEQNVANEAHYLVQQYREEIEEYL